MAMYVVCEAYWRLCELDAARCSGCMVLRRSVVLEEKVEDVCETYGTATHVIDAARGPDASPPLFIFLDLYLFWAEKIQ